MPRSPRRRITSHEVNRELQGPAFAGLSREQRRAVAQALRMLNDVSVPPLRLSSSED
jgi:hypothetical protein